jgi:hypothetical protein
LLCVALSLTNHYLKQANQKKLPAITGSFFQFDEKLNHRVTLWNTFLR